MGSLSVDTEYLENLQSIIYWARRYCDGRSTYAPSSFNYLYDYFVQLHPELKELDQSIDRTLMGEGQYFPYAQDGQFDEHSGMFDARRYK